MTRGGRPHLPHSGHPLLPPWSLPWSPARLELPAIPLPRDAFAGVEPDPDRLDPIRHEVALADGQRDSHADVLQRRRDELAYRLHASPACWQARVPGPPDAVLAAFGVTDNPAVLPGGKGGTWRAGQLVLKPVELLAETLWRSEVLTGLAGSTGFRVARPVRTLNGAWVAQGWEACQLVAGEPDVSRQDDVLRAGIAFHAAIADLPRPAFLDLRDDPWAYGDHVAWQELPVHACPAALELLAPLSRARRPVDLASQVVHGDLPGNVLFAGGLPPAIIDWPAYWRPASWALAVTVADALCWYGASPDLAARWSHQPG